MVGLRTYQHPCRRGKVKTTAEHAMRAQRGARSAALTIQNLDAEGGGGSALHPGRFTPGIRLISQEAGWPSGSVLTGVEKHVLIGFQTPESPDRRESLYRLCRSCRLLWRLCVGSVKIKWTLCTTRRHVGEVEVHICAFLTLTLVKEGVRPLDAREWAPGSKLNREMFGLQCRSADYGDEEKTAPTENVIQIPWVPNTECHNVAVHNSDPQTPDLHRGGLNHCGFLVRERHTGAGFSPKISVYLSQLLFHTWPIHIYQKVFCIRPHLRMRPQRGFNFSSLVK